MNFLTYDEVAAKIKVHRKTVWKWVIADKFPRPKVMHGIPRFVESDVEKWMKALPS